jgi:hypothetical protein
MYLEDNTIEVLEINEPNRGADTFPLLLRRTRLPHPNREHANRATNAGMGTTITVPVRADICYGPEDLHVGAAITFLGRTIRLFDCDQFTKDWYKNNLGYTDEEVTGVVAREEQSPPMALQVPAWNGYGTLEDSVQNCLKLDPKPPKTNFHKMVIHAKTVLRFRARMVEHETTSPLANADDDRRFIFTYFLADDTLGIFEPPVRNSGVIGGKYLERSEVFHRKTTTPIKAHDLFIGAVIIVNNRAFQILDADEFTLAFMESNPDVFGYANVTGVVDTTKKALTGKEDTFKEALVAAAGGANDKPLEISLLAGAFERVQAPLEAHEIITLYRAVAKGEGKVTVETVATALGMAL